MKKIIVTLMLAMFVAVSGLIVFAQDKKGVKTSDVTNVVNAYKGKDGVTVFSIGNLGMSMVKGLAKLSDDPEAAKIMKGLDKMVIVEYAEAADEIKAEFSDRISNVLVNAETIMSVRESGTTMNMYGTISETGDTIGDLIIFVPSDCALICFFGKISADVMGF